MTVDEVYIWIKTKKTDFLVVDVRPKVAWHYLGGIPSMSLTSIVVAIVSIPFAYLAFLLMSKLEVDGFMKHHEVKSTVLRCVELEYQTETRWDVPVVVEAGRYKWGFHLGHLIGGPLLGIGSVLMIGCEIRTYARLEMAYLTGLTSLPGFMLGYMPYTCIRMN